MSYRLIDANEIAIKYPEVNDMNCIYADLPNGMDGKLYNFHGKEAGEGMKIEYQCINCGKKESTSAMAGVPNGMYRLNYRAVGAALYCPDCVNTWSERHSKSFDEQYRDSLQMFKNWWNREVKRQASIEGKTVKKYRVTAWGDYVEVIDVPQEDLILALEK